MKNDIITLKITDITPEGFGVGRYDGKAVFVPDTAIGDEISAVIVKELKNLSYAKALDIISPSADRIAPDCSVCKRCGGCAFRHISYESELELKRRFVNQAFLRIGGMDITVNPTVSGSSMRYRNKVQYPIAPDEDRNCSFGYYARHSHRIIEHSDCPLQDKIFTDIADFCCKTADKIGLSAYDEANANGVMRHIVMRKNRVGEILVCIVVASFDKKRLMLLADALKTQFKSIIGIHINLNKQRNNVIFGDETFCLLGEEALTDTLLGKDFELSPRAFYQVNAPMAETLYSHAKKLAKSDKGGNIILDLYCGTGTIGICIADKTDKLCGVEIIESAVENAKRNAEKNGRSEKNTLFVCGDASVGVKECKRKFGKPNIIIVDPPRKGLDLKVIEAVVSASPERIIYISCDPATLARDCAVFKNHGYITEEATPFDLFPRTGHVETIVCLNKR